MTQSKTLCVAILGPTASGKTGFAVDVALKLGGEIICVDSTTVYRGFDIGTSKPSAQLRQQVPHHLLDELEPDATFSAGEFIERARQLMQEIKARGKLPILVGGSYFYFRALQNGMYPTPTYDDNQLDAIADEFSHQDGLDLNKLHAALNAADPQAAEGIHPNDAFRLLRAMTLVRSGHTPSQLKPVPPPGDWIWMKYAMAVSRKTLNENIALRTRGMLQQGLLNEVRALLEKHPKARTLGSIGYEQCVQWLEHPSSEQALVQSINESTRRLVKRQLTWLRSDPEVRFIDSRDLPRVELEINNLRSVLEMPCNR